MGHFQIAYDVFVIMIGFAALSNVFFWVLKSGETYLRDFSILYSLFTGALICGVLREYLSLNVVNYPGWPAFIISGIGQVMGFAVIVAAIHFLLGVYRVKNRKTISIVFLLSMIISDILLLSPIGATLNANSRTIHLGIGYQIAFGWYFLSFTCLLVMGYALLNRVWHTKKRNFVIGLLFFASVGYIETIGDILAVQRQTQMIPAAQGGFQISTIPYALYGIFLIYYFLTFYTPGAADMKALSKNFLEQYGITERENEIILRVIQGKSNAQIGDELFISLATVKTHLHNIYRKIGIDSRFDLIACVRSDQYRH